MKRFIDEFKKFAMKGNVVDLAVAVIIGAAFGKITTSLVNDIAMPLVGILVGGVDLAKLSIDVGQATVMYGKFIQSVIDFFIIALIIFIAVKMINMLHKKQEEKEVKKMDKDVELLTEIRDILKDK
jgi:large conductance mechanosensitive channel